MAQAGAGIPDGVKDTPVRRRTTSQSANHAEIAVRHRLHKQYIYAVTVRCVKLLVGVGMKLVCNICEYMITMRLGKPVKAAL
jgi:hypothetical protein